MKPLFKCMPDTGFNFKVIQQSSRVIKKACWKLLLHTEDIEQHFLCAKV